MSQVKRKGYAIVIGAWAEDFESLIALNIDTKLIKWKGTLIVFSQLIKGYQIVFNGWRKRVHEKMVAHYNSQWIWPSVCTLEGEWISFIGDMMRGPRIKELVSIYRCDDRRETYRVRQKTLLIGWQTKISLWRWWGTWRWVIVPIRTSSSPMVENNHISDMGVGTNSYLCLDHRKLCL